MSRALKVWSIGIQERERKPSLHFYSREEKTKPHLERELSHCISSICTAVSLFIAILSFPGRNVSENILVSQAGQKKSVVLSLLNLTLWRLEIDFI